MKTVISIIAIVCLSTTGSTQTPDCFDYTDLMPIVTEVPFADSQPTRAVLVGTDKMVLYSGYDMDVVDISDRSQPVRVGRVDRPYNGCLALAARGQYVYCVNSDGIHVLDVGVPSMPVWVGQVGASGLLRDLAISGDLLAAASSGGTQLYSLADPVLPALVGTVAQATSVTFLDDGRLALLFNGFAVVDVSDPGQPVETCRLQFEEISDYEYFETTYVRNLLNVGTNLLGRCEHVVRTGSIPHGTDHVIRRYSRRVFNTFGPGEPTEIQNVSAGSSEEFDAAVFPALRSGDLLFEGREVVDLSTGTLATGWLLPFIEPIDDGLFAGVGDEVLVVSSTGLLSVDVDAFQVPNAVMVPATAYRSYCSKADANEELWINSWYSHWYGDVWHTEVQYGFGAGEVTTVLTSGESIGARLFDDMVLVTEYDAPARLYQVTPADVTQYGFPLDSVDEILDGPGRIIAVMEDDLLTVFDMVDPAVPVATGSLDLAGAGHGHRSDVAILDDRVLIAGSAGVVLVSIADPADPVVLSALVLADVAWVEFWTPDQTTAQVGDELYRLDFSDPAAPAVAFSVPAGYVTYPPAVSGDMGYFLGDDAVYSEGTLVHLLDMATLDQLGVAVLDNSQFALNVMANGSLAASGHRNGWTAIPAACEVLVGVDDDLPARATSLSVYPNPFNPQTSVALDMVREERAELTVFDTRGRRLRSFDLGILPAGRHHVTWNGRDESGRELPAGVYLLKLTSEAGTATAKAVLVR